MRFLAKTILIAGLCYISQQFFPWWSIVICSFLIGVLLPTKELTSFLSGFLGVGLLWLLFSWSIDVSTDSILTEKIAQLFSLNQAGLLIAATGALGGIVGGFAALTGSLLRNLNRNEPIKPGYYH